MTSYIRKAIELVDMQTAWTEKQLLSGQTSVQHPAKLKWTGSIVEWVELIYALYLVKRINNGKGSLGELFLQMGEMFDFEVTEYAGYFMNIKNRTDGNRTKFTNLMYSALLKRMNEADRKLSRK